LPNLQRVERKLGETGADRRVGDGGGDAGRNPQVEAVGDQEVGGEGVDDLRLVVDLVRLPGN
jgi:hypothetical protein